MALIYCEKCGGRVSDKAYVCVHCGAPLHKIVPKQEVQKPSQETPVQQPVANGGRPVAPQPFEPDDEPQSQNHYLLIALIVLVALCGVGFGVYYIIDANAKKEKAKWEQAYALQLREDSLEQVARDSAEKVRKDSLERLAHASAGLTFRTFTKRENFNGNNINWSLDEDEVVRNLEALGFSFVKRETIYRDSYDPAEEAEGVKERVDIDTYAKTVGDRTTTVKLNENDTEIHFPNTADVKEFETTIAGCGMKKTKGRYVDIIDLTTDPYASHTEITIKGTVVDICFVWYW